MKLKKSLLLLCLWTPHFVPTNIWNPKSQWRKSRSKWLAPCVNPMDDYLVSPNQLKPWKKSQKHTFELLAGLFWSCIKHLKGPKSYHVLGIKEEEFWSVMNGLKHKGEREGSLHHPLECMALNWHLYLKKWGTNC